MAENKAAKAVKDAAMDTDQLAAEVARLGLENEMLRLQLANADLRRKLDAAREASS